MALSWNEIRDRATQFAHEWADEKYERGEAQTFWNEFFQVFGITRRRVASFEKHVAKLGEQSGFIDCFWPGTLIAEHKSKGGDLDSAFLQAIDYLVELKERELPRYVVVSDFATIRLYDLEEDTDIEFSLKQFPRRIKRFGFIAGYSPQVLQPEDPVNIRAAERMGKLHDYLRECGYTGHKLEVLLVRLLFCLFADDTGIFQPSQAFRLWLEDRTAEDGSDLGSRLAHAFQVMNTRYELRSSALDEQLADFPFINGQLFEESLPIASFNSQMREALLEACAVDWSQISPAVFGAMFQSIMDREARRNLGAHYTSEQNIEKLIKPLFLDDLREEFDAIKHNKKKLFDFHNKLRALTFLDPACGCGNFLVVTYRALRELELDVLRAALKLERDSGQQLLDVQDVIKVDVDQFYGIEIEEFPARIAEVALWLTDHQMNLIVGEEFGSYFARIPLKTTPKIHHGNALKTDWNGIIPKGKLKYILGNPPFVGKKFQTREQKGDLAEVLGHIPGSGVLDLVSGWYVKATDFIKLGPTTKFREDSAPDNAIRCAFVSTNSISQGEQVGVLWSYLLSQGVKIHFAHRTFQWSNEAAGKAAVHCVIVGFGLADEPNKTIFEYSGVKSEPHAIAATNINPYLVDASDVVVTSRRTPLNAPLDIRYGSFALDGGFFTIDESDKEEILRVDSAAAKFLRPFVGGKELLHGIQRWAIWLLDSDPSEWRNIAPILDRVRAVQGWRLQSNRRTTKELADTPSIFAEVRQPETNYLAIPTASSEKRKYIPIELLSRETVASNQLYIVPDAAIYHFGILHSAMHNAWVRYTCGRLKSDFRYSAGLVYNNYPWPKQSSSGSVSIRIEKAAQKVIDTRKHYPRSTLAELYNQLTMPPELLKAHKELDRAVDGAYSRREFRGDTDRMAFLVERFSELKVGQNGPQI